MRCKTCEETFIQRLRAGEVSAGCCAPIRTKKQSTSLRGSPEDSPVPWGASPTRKNRANAACLVCEIVQTAKGCQVKSSNEQEAATEPEAGRIGAEVSKIT